MLLLLYYVMIPFLHHDVISVMLCNDLISYTLHHDVISIVLWCNFLSITLWYRCCYDLLCCVITYFPLCHDTTSMTLSHNVMLIIVCHNIISFTRNFILLQYILLSFPLRCYFQYVKLLHHFHYIHWSFLLPCDMIYIASNPDFISITLCHDIISIML